MEKLPVNITNNIELQKTEQSVENFLLSEQEKNIQEVFKLNPGLKNIAVEAIESGETISLYRIENKNIEREPDGVTSHKDLKGQWFTPNLDTALTYLRKSQQTFGTEANRVEGANLVVVKIPKEEFENLHVSKHPIASQMDFENDNYIIPENIERNYINLDDVQNKIGNFENFQKAKKQVEEKIESSEQKEAVKLYQKYLETIFPESKIKDIFWHGSPSKIDNFLSPGSEGYKKQETTTTGVAGIYFSDKKHIADKYQDFKKEGVSGYTYPVLLNVKKPIIVGDKATDGITDNTLGIVALWNIQKGVISGLRKSGVDAIKTGEYASKKEENTEIAVFDTEQIHILGSRSDIEKFKEFILSKNEIQKIDDLSFEEVSSDTSDSIEIKVYKDDSEEIVLKKLKEKLVKENWWFQDEFKNEGFPKEQFIINGNQNEYSIYNFNENLSEEQKNSIIKGISFLENSNEISSLKDITILIRKIEKINSNSQQPLYGSYYEGSKVINIHPRALKNEGYREIPEISGLEATIIHEFSHPIYDKIEQKLKEKWSDFGWETTTEEEQKNENMYAIKPKESNKCITKYAQFAPDEDFCESIVALYAKSLKLDSEKKMFLESKIFNEIENLSLAQMIKKEKIELPRLPENIKFHKKEVPKISIIKK